MVFVFSPPQSQFTEPEPQSPEPAPTTAVTCVSPALAVGSGINMILCHFPFELPLTLSHPFLLLCVEYENEMKSGIYFLQTQFRHFLVSARKGSYA